MKRLAILTAALTLLSLSLSGCIIVPAHGGYYDGPPPHGYYYH
jgi:hypothetical protein